MERTKKRKKEKNMYICFKVAKTRPWPLPFCFWHSVSVTSLTKPAYNSVSSVLRQYRYDVHGTSIQSMRQEIRVSVVSTFLYQLASSLCVLFNE